MSKPNLFIVGAQKCGTTSLHYYLDQHPDIFMTNLKEPHYFCSDLHQIDDAYSKDSFIKQKFSERFFPIRKKSDYLELFKFDSSLKYEGETSPAYLFSEVSAKKIYEYNPDSKIIIGLREPTDLMYSMYNYYYKNYRENAETFDEALKLEDKRKKGEKIPEKVTFPPELFYKEFATYSKQVSRFISVFPKDQIKIYFFEDFKEDNDAVYKSILDFLDVEYFKPDYERKNQGRVPKESTKPLFKFCLFLINFFSILPAKKILPLDMRRKIGSFFLKPISEKKTDENSINSETKIELKKEFAEEIQTLATLLENKGFIQDKKDVIKKWGYEDYI